jgi:hypothetical protein
MKGSEDKKGNENESEWGITSQCSQTSMEIRKSKRTQLPSCGLGSVIGMMSSVSVNGVEWPPARVRIQRRPHSCLHKQSQHLLSTMLKMRRSWYHIGRAAWIINAHEGREPLNHSGKHEKCEVKLSHREE